MGLARGRVLEQELDEVVSELSVVEESRRDLEQ